MTALLGAVPATQAQDAVPAPAQSANQGASSPASSAASSGQTPANGTNGTGAPRSSGTPHSGGAGPGRGASAVGASGTHAPGASASGNPGVAPGQATASTPESQAGDKPGRKAAVCFKLTGRCVEASKASGTQGGPAAAGAGTSKDGASQRALNLNAPDVRSVVPAEQLKEPLPTNDQIVETQESDTVNVQTDKGVPPDVPGGFGALWWALNHPSQAWRILAPAE
jgi:hypothetical protein